MIYPSQLNLVILQDSTFELDLIVTESVKSATVNDATNVITSFCHGFAAGDRVAFAADGGSLPCGITGGVAYHVLSSGLTNSAFKISTTAGGSEVDFTVATLDATYMVGKAINLTPFTFDADIRSDFGEPVVASFSCVKLDAPSGTMRLVLTATQTQALAAGDYVWDLKFKTAQSSFFYAKGAVSVQSTVSRD